LRQPRQEFFFAGGGVQSPQRFEDYGPETEDVLCCCLITKARTIYKLDILDTYLGFGFVGGLECKCSSSRTAACEYE